MPPSAHARLSPSAAHRFLVCTAAPSFEAQFPDTSSPYAEEGTLAHAVAEIYASHWRNGTDAATERLPDSITDHPLYNPEMHDTAAAYVDQLRRLAAAHGKPPNVRLEQRLDLTNWLPDSFGTADCTMVSHKRITVCDYKHGKGARVEAENNPQMRYYALGALDRYGILLTEDATIHTAIIQPRLDHVSEEEISAAELRRWGAANIAAAEAAYSGEGAVFVPGEHCRFCRGKTHCRARAQAQLRLDGYRAAALTDAEIGEILRSGKDLVQWFKDLKDYAAKQLLAGRDIPGWKMVEGRRTREFKDTAAAFAALRESGIDDAMLYDRSPKSLTAIESMVGKKAFAELTEEHVHKPRGKPTLAPAEDKRPAYSSAAADFEGITS